MTHFQPKLPIYSQTILPHSPIPTTFQIPNPFAIDALTSTRMQSMVSLFHPMMTPIFAPPRVPVKRTYPSHLEASVFKKLKAAPEEPYRLPLSTQHTDNSKLNCSVKPTEDLNNFTVIEDTADLIILDEEDVYSNSAHAKTPVKEGCSKSQTKSQRKADKKRCLEASLNQSRNTCLSKRSFNYEKAKTNEIVIDDSDGEESIIEEITSDAFNENTRPNTSSESSLSNSMTIPWKFDSKQLTEYYQRGRSQEAVNKELTELDQAIRALDSLQQGRYKLEPKKPQFDLPQKINLYTFQMSNPFIRKPAGVPVTSILTGIYPFSSRERLDFGQYKLDSSVNFPSKDIISQFLPSAQPENHRSEEISAQVERSINEVTVAEVEEDVFSNNVSINIQNAANLSSSKESQDESLKEVSEENTDNPDKKLTSIDLMKRKIIKKLQETVLDNQRQSHRTTKRVHVEPKRSIVSCLEPNRSCKKRIRKWKLTGVSRGDSKLNKKDEQPLRIYRQTKTGRKWIVKTPVGKKYQATIIVNHVSSDKIKRVPKVLWDPSKVEDEELKGYFKKLEEMFEYDVNHEKAVKILRGCNNDVKKAIDMIGDKRQEYGRKLTMNTRKKNLAGEKYEK